MCARRKAADKKKVLFSDEFYSDMTAPDMLHAVLVRSPFSCGTISSIGFEPKTKIPAGYELFTAQDLPQEGRANILGTNVPLLCAGEIAYKGEPLALLVGADKEILEELKASVRIGLDTRGLKADESRFARSYHELSAHAPLKAFSESPLKASPLTTSPASEGSPIEESIRSLRNTLAEFAKPREIIAKRSFSVGNADDIFSDPEKAAFIVEGTWLNRTRCRPNKETEGCLCSVKAGNLHIFTPSQWISQLRQTVSSFTGFPKDKIFITRTCVSVKTTNSLWQNCVLATLTALLALKTGQSVRLSLSRTEQEELIETPPEIKITHKTALDKNGILTAMRVSIDFDAGAYNPLAADILDRLAIASTGIYNCKNVRVSARAYKSRRPPASLPLSMIDSHSFFAMENQIQKIAEETGFSPVDLRQMNKAGGLQKVTAPFTYSFGRSSDAINAVAIRGDFKRKYAVSRLAEHGLGAGVENTPHAPPLRGIGLACAFEGSSYLGPHFDKSAVSLHVTVTEEKKLIVHACPPSAAVRDIWLRLITDNLEIERRNISFAGEFMDETGKKKDAITIPETLVGMVSIRTILLKKCVDSIKRKKLENAPFSVKKNLPASRKKAWNQEEFAGAPYYNTAFGTCTVEVELDTCTFREKLRKICVIIDGGRILAPKAAESAVYRSIQRCLSSLVEDDTLRCPAISVQFMQSEEEPKQIGHLIYSILPAAYTSALSQALAVTVGELPLQTDSLFRISERHKQNAHSEATGGEQ